jgi:hypothetical protein
MNNITREKLREFIVNYYPNNGIKFIEFVNFIEENIKYGKSLIKYGESLYFKEEDIEELSEEWNILKVNKQKELRSNPRNSDIVLNFNLDLVLNTLMKLKKKNLLLLYRILRGRVFHDNIEIIFYTAITPYTYEMFINLIKRYINDDIIDDIIDIIDYERFIYLHSIFPDFEIPDSDYTIEYLTGNSEFFAVLYSKIISNDNVEHFIDAFDMFYDDVREEANNRQRNILSDKQRDIYKLRNERLIDLRDYIKNNVRFTDFDIGLAANKDNTDDLYKYEDNIQKFKRQIKKYSLLLVEELPIPAVVSPAVVSPAVVSQPVLSQREKHASAAEYRRQKQSSNGVGGRKLRTKKIRNRNLRRSIK